MREMLKRAAVVLVLVAVLCVSFAAAEESVLVGLEAPDFEVTTLDGEVFRLSEHRGKVVYVNIWATWCPPCVDEIPDIQKLAEAHPDELAVIGVSIDDSREDVEAFVAENGCTYPIGMDEGYRLAVELFPTQYIPESVFTSPNGVITGVRVGGLSYEEMEACFREALAQ